MKNANTELVSFTDIVSNNFFKIPDYQRGYSWEEKQLIDLRKDIENLYNKNYRHFTGTIVASEVKENYFHVVDGQQRITTLIILINEACKLIPELTNLKNTFIYRGSMGKEEYVFETNEETKDFFFNQILKNNPQQGTVKSHFRIKDAQDFFKNWFKEKGVDTSKIVKIVTQQFGFIFFSPKDTKEIGIMFEVINNRGKALSELEKIKNYFIYYASIHEYKTFREEVNSVWSKLLINLSIAHVYSNDDENRFLRNCYIVFFDHSKSRSWNVYEELKKRFNPEEAIEEKLENDFIEIKQFIDFLEKASLHYAYLFNYTHFETSNTGPQKNEFQSVLKQFRCQPTKASFLPMYLAVMSYFDKEPIITLEILKLIEIANFRVYLLPKITSRADSMQGELFRFAHELYNYPHWHTDQEDGDVLTHYNSLKVVGSVFDWIKAELVQFTLFNCSEKKFIQSLTIDNDEGDDYYHWKGIRFFLGSFEVFKQSIISTTFDLHNILKQRADANVKGNDFYSLEHVWASANRENYHTKWHKEKRRLGNFVLLGLSKNIQLSNNDVPAKVTELNTQNPEKGFGHIPLVQVSDLKSKIKDAINFVEKNIQTRKTQNYYKYLSEFINDKRETEMIQFALKRWALPNENLINFEKVNTFETREINENFIMKNN